MKLFIVVFTLFFGGYNDKDFTRPKWLEVRDAKGALVTLYQPNYGMKTHGQCSQTALPNPVYSYDGERFVFCAAKSADYSYRIISK